MKITVNVTQADIDAGMPGFGCDCPVALAVHRALPHLPGAYVYSYGVATSAHLEADPFGSVDVFADLPRAARDFITRFDGSEQVEPFSFELELPDELAPAVTS